MRSDDELLSHIRQQAGVRRQRRQRAVAGAAAAVVALLVGVGALAATGGDDGETVKAEDGPSTTTTEAPTTTEVPTTAEDTTTTTSTSSTTTPTTTAPPDTEPPPTTTEPPPTTTAPESIAPVSQTAVGDGITMTVTATQDLRRPGEVTLTIRIQADHGSAPSGYVDWDVATWGPDVEADEFDGFGGFEDDVPLDCIPDEAAPLRPDADAGQVDATFTKVHGYGGRTGPLTLRVLGDVSWCTTDEASTDLELEITLPG